MGDEGEFGALHRAGGRDSRTRDATDTLAVFMTKIRGAGA
jgi:hypothetical protein